MSSGGTYSDGSYSHQTYIQKNRNTRDIFYEELSKRRRALKMGTFLPPEGDEIVISDDENERPSPVIKTESGIPTKIKTEHPNIIQHSSDFQSTVLLSLTQLLKNQDQILRSLTKCVEHLTVMSSVFNEQPVQKALRELMEKRGNRAVDGEGSGLESEDEDDNDEAGDEKKGPRTIDEKLSGKLASTNTETGIRESLPRETRAAFYETLDGAIEAEEKKIIIIIAIMMMILYRRYMFIARVDMAELLLSYSVGYYTVST